MSNLFTPRITTEKCDRGVWWPETDDGFQRVFSERLIYRYIDTIGLRCEGSKRLPLRWGKRR